MNTNEQPPVPDNWRDEMANYVSDKKEVKLLKEGPHSLAQSWHLMALRHRYKRIKGIKDVPAPDCQSSFKEWNKGVDDKKESI